MNILGYLLFRTDNGEAEQQEQEPAAAASNTGMTDILISILYCRAFFCGLQFL